MLLFEITAKGEFNSNPDVVYDRADFNGPFNKGI